MSPVYKSGAKRKKERASTQQEGNTAVLHAHLYAQISDYHNEKDKSGEVETRQMTPEERKKYGLE